MFYMRIDMLFPPHSTMAEIPWRTMFFSFFQVCYRNFYISLVVSYKNNLCWIINARFVFEIKRLFLAIFAIGIRYI